MPLESSPFVFFFTLFSAIIDTKCLPQKLQVNFDAIPSNVSKWWQVPKTSSFNQIIIQNKAFHIQHNSFIIQNGGYMFLILQDHQLGQMHC